jgi:hypothetical protein
MTLIAILRFLFSARTLLRCVLKQDSSRSISHRTLAKVIIHWRHLWAPPGHSHIAVSDHIRKPHINGTPISLEADRDTNVYWSSNIDKTHQDIESRLDPTYEEHRRLPGTYELSPSQGYGGFSDSLSSVYNQPSIHR